MLSKKKRKALERARQREEDWKAGLLKKSATISAPPCARITSGIPSYSHRSSDVEYFRGPIEVAMDYAAKRVALQYTGTSVVGIAQLHKSNAIPVFSQQEAIDAATMRRN